MAKPTDKTCSALGMDILCWLAALLGLVIAGIVLAVSIIVALTVQ